ncbi:winged helix-turn-helix transcriptional regulator [Novosphingobium humi]|uniref:Helix-turn-helix domain-containing protein n=1 Tax=Novosphingobium humi TaxID=2282397 RepID=A0ABY7TWA1_9SPHN|nr:helix-turn-helix domain-containing protein [Novosphingobium humi]WCT77288.1 helix-turn-helix domain-containing protein [Novosphingobium humi]
MQESTFLSPAYPDVTASKRGDVFARNCPTRQLLDRVGDKWSILLLGMLGEGEMRFSALKRRVDGISQKMLAQTLRTLERDGLISRHVEPTVPVSVTYAITPLGRELLGALQWLIDWAETRMGAVAEAQIAYDLRMAD